MKKEDFFNFEEFLKRDNNDVKTKPVNSNPIKEESVIKEKTDESIVENIIEIVEDIIETPIEEDNSYYNLYKDKGDEFTCDISIEGSSIEETYARIILESEDWSLIFPGTIRNGKCVVPIKKLGILKEGEIGRIKLEVVTEGNLFIPWEDDFKVKLSKKVTVNVNENKTIQKESGIKVNINR